MKSILFGRLMYSQKLVVVILIENEMIILCVIVPKFNRSLCSKLSLIVPFFDTKVTEYLCARWIFFSRQISTSHSKTIVVLSLNVKRFFTCDLFRKVMGV